MTESELKLFRQLADGSFHSGEELGGFLGISRAAVWKRINVLEKHSGHPIEGQAGKGYRLLSPVEFLCADDIVTKLGAQKLGISVYQSLDSTNEKAREFVGHDKGPSVILAEMQKAGRGRRGRSWHSPYACNLYLSLVWPLTDGIREAEGMSLITGLVVCKLLQRHGLTKAGLKWPNDVLADDKKIAGILLELVGDPADRGVVIVGVGININMQGQHEGIDQAWTSLKVATGQSVSRNQLAAELVTDLLAALKRNRAKGFADFASEWEEHHLWRGRQVSLSAGGSLIEGKVVGIETTGALRLLTADGEQSFAGGEISLRLRHDSGS